MAKTEQLTFVQVLRESQPATWLPMVLLFSVGYWLSGIAFGWMWVVGVLYFTLPFNFMARWIIDGKSTDKNHGEYWIVLLAGNIPFWLYFWANGTRGAGIWLCLVVILAAVYEYGKRHTRHLPGIDILMAATMAVLPFTFGASQSSSTLPLWLPAAVILFLWASAGYLYRGLLQSQPQSTATLLGPEKVLMTCLAFYAVAAVLPSIFLRLVRIARGDSADRGLYVYCAAYALP